LRKEITSGTVRMDLKEGAEELTVEHVPSEIKA
jgi:hypothetical protein